MRLLVVFLLMGAAAVMLPVVLVYSGAFDVAADVPHSALVYATLRTIRDRSIAARAKQIRVPPLDDPQQVAAGARHYADMCSNCHLAPDMKSSEIRDGLYPKPPNLAQGVEASPAEMFWVIKHGIRMSAMPAWGLTHDDESIWSIVGFLQTLPKLTPDQYRALVSTGDEAHHHYHSHTHQRDK